MNKTAVAFIVAAVFLIGLSVNSFPVVRVARANPFEAPEWTILSPKNNAAYNTDSFNLSFRVATIFDYDYYYSLDSASSEVFWGGASGQGKTLVNTTLVSEIPRTKVSSLKTFQYNTELHGLSDGQHNLTLYYGYTDNFGWRFEPASATIIFYVNSVVPKITNLSINSQDAGAMLLDFTVDEATSWIGYSLDNQANVTVNGDVILNDLSTGFHHVTVYAEDEAGNKGASETLCFTVEEPESETIKSTAEEPDLVPLVLVSMGTCFAVCVGLLVYFKKRKH
jgi:hypothetical protein